MLLEVKDLREAYDDEASWLLKRLLSILLRLYLCESRLLLSDDDEY